MLFAQSIKLDINGLNKFVNQTFKILLVTEIKRWLVGLYQFILARLQNKFYNLYIFNRSQVYFLELISTKQ